MVEWHKWVVLFEDDIKESGKLYSQLEMIFNKDVEEYGITQIIFLENENEKDLVDYFIKSNKHNINLERYYIGNEERDKNLILQSDFCLFNFQTLGKNTKYLWKLVYFAKENKKAIIIE